MEGGAPQASPKPPPATEDQAAPAADAAAETAEKAEGEGEGDKADGFDMFNDDVEEAEVAEEALDEAAAMDRGDNYDDKEGYYAHRIGDLLNDRYKVRADPACTTPHAECTDTPRTCAHTHN